jgi:hypothetical protein
MKGRPLANESQRPARKVPVQDPCVEDRDLRFVLGVPSVEVRRGVIIEVHRHDDAVERGDARHRFGLRLAVERIGHPERERDERVGTPLLG